MNRFSRKLLSKKFSWQRLGRSLLVIYTCFGLLLCPVLVMHGQADPTIPSQHGRSLYQAAPEPKMSLWIAGAGHNHVSEVAGDRHRQALLSFQQLIETGSGDKHLKSLTK